MRTIASKDITVQDFKDHFTRDFKYASDHLLECQSEYVTDADITKSFNEALVNFNDTLFSDDIDLKITFLLLSAHYLAWDLQSAVQGAKSTGVFPVSSRTVGPVTESYSVPAWLQKDPVFSAYATTRYGLKYISIIKPLLLGGVAVYSGSTLP